MGVEALVDLSMDIENGLPDLVRGPGNAREVGVGHIPARENFIPIAVRAQEVNRGPAGDSMPGRTEVDFHIIPSQDIAGP